MSESQRRLVLDRSGSVGGLAGEAAGGNGLQCSCAIPSGASNHRQGTRMLVILQHIGSVSVHNVGLRGMAHERRRVDVAPPPSSTKVVAASVGTSEAERSSVLWTARTPVISLGDAVLTQGIEDVPEEERCADCRQSGATRRHSSRTPDPVSFTRARRRRH